MAVDVQPQSIAVARENALRTGVAERIRVARGSLGADWPFDNPPQEIADLVVANIHARVLIDLAEDLTAALTPPGAIILSGIIADREADVRNAYHALGYSVWNALAEGDWRTLALRPSG
jgi:ribosomal protein L11 methyltransferase